MKYEEKNKKARTGSKSGKTDITSCTRDYHGNPTTKHYDKQVAFVKNKKVKVERESYIESVSQMQNRSSLSDSLSLS